MNSSPQQTVARNRLSIERINRHAAEHGVAVSRVDVGAIDKTRFFTCPTLTPLWHDPVYGSLSTPQQLRYNQLCGLMQNELICFFEQELGGNVLPALLRSNSTLPQELARSLARFLEEERKHTAMFRRLNRLAEPRWYERSDHHVLRAPKAFLTPLRWLARRPSIFPVVFWIMLMMEERTLLMSRRYSAMDPDSLDPLFGATYRAHAEDEVRHVQLDWHLLERFYEGRPAWLRRLNARLLQWIIVGVFLKPRRANVRVVELLIEDHPELEPRRAELLKAVRGLAENAGYRRMMYSAEAMPIAWSLLERCPELKRFRADLASVERP